MQCLTVSSEHSHITFSLLLLLLRIHFRHLFNVLLFHRRRRHCCCCSSNHGRRVSPVVQFTSTFHAANTFVVQWNVLWWENMAWRMFRSACAMLFNETAVCSRVNLSDLTVHKVEFRNGKLCEELTSSTDSRSVMISPWFLIKTN